MYYALKRSVESLIVKEYFNDEITEKLRGISALVIDYQSALH
jgi:hypothetical protein